MQVYKYYEYVKEIACRNCGVTFKPSHNKGKFCSRSCSASANGRGICRNKKGANGTAIHGSKYTRPHVPPEPIKNEHCLVCVSVPPKKGEYCNNCYYQILRYISRLRSVNYLGAVCSGCKSSMDFSAFDFHHKEGKKDTIANMIARHACWAELKSELDKCELLCCHCHRSLHLHIEDKMMAEAYKNLGRILHDATSRIDGKCRVCLLRIPKQKGSRCTVCVKKIVDIAKKIVAVEHLGGKCIDCNGVFPLFSFEFHHIGDKNDGITRMIKDGLSIKKILKEAARCVLLCCACHRLRHRRAVSGRFFRAVLEFSTRSHAYALTEAERNMVLPVRIELTPEF